MTDLRQDFSDWLPEVRALTAKAGELVMVYYKGAREHKLKADASPVTEADLAANELIVQALTELAPHVPVISEEGSHALPAGADLFWLVDPIDGTKSFIRGKPSFTVNIGLIHRGAPVLGAIDIPAQGVSYYGSEKDGAFRQRHGQAAEPIRTRKPPAEGLTAIISHSHSTPETDAYLAKLPVIQRTSAASSLKFCLVAEGTADLYPRFGPTMEWDTAAGHAILAAAGGRVVTPEGLPFGYGKAGFRNHYFIAQA